MTSYSATGGLHLPSAATDYYDIATYEATVTYLQTRLPPALARVEAGIVCGSGLGGLVKCFDGETVEFDYKDIPAFATSTVHGHVGKFVFGLMSGVPVVCMLGRKHLYEGHSILRTVYPIRIMRLLGASTLIVTNAAGGLNPTFNIGDIMFIADHVSFAGLGGANPLIGPNIETLGPRFPATSDAYDFRLRVKAIQAALKTGISQDLLREGIYTFVVGPSFETRAEARFLRDAVGADCVGMSTVPEVVAARHCGMKVLGLSLITNMVSVGKGRTAMTQARWELETAAETLAPKPIVSAPPTQSSTTDDQGLFELDADTSKTSKANNEVTDDELQLANHEEVLHTSSVRSDSMQKIVKTFLAELRLESSTSTAPAVAN